MDKKRYKGTGPTYEELARVVSETMGSNVTPETLYNVVERDMAPVADAWRDMASRGRATLETLYKSTGDRDKAIADTMKAWEDEFGMPREVKQIQTNRDIYNALKGVYDQSGGDWDMVARVAKYNRVPKELMDKFVKDGKWTDYSIGDEAGAGYGAVARGATDVLYGGVANVLTGGKWANVDVVPKGVEYEDQSNTKWRAGIKQVEAYRRSLKETDPGMELFGELVGMAAPLSAASKIAKGVKVVQGATRLGRVANTAARGAATGALYSIPASLAKDNVSDAVANTLLDAGVFATGDVALSGLGAGLGFMRRGASKVSRGVAEAPEGIIKTFQNIKPISEMSEKEIQHGVKQGWIKDGKFSIVDYLAKEKGVAGTEAMDALGKLAKGNRELYNSIKQDMKSFNYFDEIKAAATNSMINNAPLSRLNKILKTIPERLESFVDNPVGYKGFSGKNISNMADFNADVKYALRSLRPNSAEKKAIDKYLKEVESANMKQHLVSNALPKEIDAVDKSKTLIGEVLKGLSFVSPAQIVKAPGRYIEDRVQRNYIRQLINGESRRPNIVKRVLDTSGKMNTQKVYPAQQVINAQTAKIMKE